MKNKKQNLWICLLMLLTPILSGAATPSNSVLDDIPDVAAPAVDPKINATTKKEAETPSLPEKQKNSEGSTKESKPVFLTNHESSVSKEYTQYGKQLGSFVELQYICALPESFKKEYQEYLKKLSEFLSTQSIGFSSFQFKNDLQEGSTEYRAEYESFTDAEKIEICKNFTSSFPEKFVKSKSVLYTSMSKSIPFVKN